MTILVCFGFNVGYHTSLGIGNRETFSLYCNVNLMLEKATIWC